MINDKGSRFYDFGEFSCSVSIKNEIPKSFSDRFKDIFICLELKKKTCFRKSRLQQIYRVQIKAYGFYWYRKTWSTHVTSVSRGVWEALQITAINFHCFKSFWNNIKFIDLEFSFV